MRQILADGGHISRNPQALVELLLDMLPTRQAFARAGAGGPECAGKRNRSHDPDGRSVSPPRRSARWVQRRGSKRIGDARDAAGLRGPPTPRQDLWRRTRAISALRQGIAFSSWTAAALRHLRFRKKRMPASFRWNSHLDSSRFWSIVEPPHSEARLPSARPVAPPLIRRWSSTICRRAVLCARPALPPLSTASFLTDHLESFVGAKLSRGGSGWRRAMTAMRRGTG